MSGKQQKAEMGITPDLAYDLLIVGGGVNGCGIARDAAGRGLSVLLCEKDDLAQATSSASTKLFHGGLRYLEYFEFRLVREALIEREVLLSTMPHISWPLRFVLPINPDLQLAHDTSPVGRAVRLFMPFLNGRRPAWLTRLGLFVYDHLGGRKLLPGTRTLNLHRHRAGRALKSRFTKAFEYSDCWVEDSRLVVLLARDAAERGADIRTRTLVKSAQREKGLWAVTLQDRATGQTHAVWARGLVNAGGPWVESILNTRLGQDSKARVRLVRGSHIVTRRLFDHEQPYFFQLSDGRIIFALPYETDFTLIGTTDCDHEGDPGDVVCTPEEKDYLIRAANEYLNTPISESDIVWTFAGVRPLYDDHASAATAATREYVFTLFDEAGRAPLLNVFGGKITTHRKLSEEAMKRLAPFFPDMAGNWTRNAPLPGGDFPVDGVERQITELMASYPFLSTPWAKRLVRAYGTDARRILGRATTENDLGAQFGATLTAAEVDWLMAKEWAQSAQDVIWRRSKLGLRLNADEIAALDRYMQSRSARS